MKFTHLLVAYIITGGAVIYLNAQNKTNCAQVPGPDVCPALLQTPARFGLSDDVIITGSRTVWLLHDRAHADKCLLVVETKVGVTAQVWSCQ